MVKMGLLLRRHLKVHLAMHSEKSAHARNVDRAIGPWLIGFLLLSSAIASYANAQSAPESVRIGILHSITGTMASSERPLIDAALLAIKEVNLEGGVLGHRLEAVVEDGASNPETFRRKAAKLVDQDGVASVFGCWTSASRKAVLEVIERRNQLLWYPVQYEGDEDSRNVIYTGAAPNQQIIPAIDWCLRQHRGNRIFLVGSDYVFPRKANQIIKKHLAAIGLDVAGEEYRPLGDWHFDDVVARILEAKPSWIFNTVNGDSNVAFFKTLEVAHNQVPVMSVSIAEAELPGIGIEKAFGHYAAWNYFQSLPSPENKLFINAFKQATAQERVTDDPIEAAYFGVHLFAKAANRAKSLDPQRIKRAALDLEFRAPGGWVRIDPATRHTWKTLRIGQIDEHGQFVVQEESPDPIAPDPFLNNPVGSTLPPLNKSLDALVQGLSNAEASQRRRASRELDLMRPGMIADYPAAASPLGRALHDEDWLVRRYASEAVVRLGAAAVDPLLEVMSSQGNLPRTLAAEALGRIGSAAYRAVPSLAEALCSADADTREQAACALGNIKAASAVPAVTAALLDDEPSVRLTAVDALGSIGGAAHPALPQLVQLWRKGGLGVYPRVARVIADIATDMKLKRDPAALPNLEAALREIAPLSTENTQVQVDRLRDAVEMLREVDKARWLLHLWTSLSANRWVVLAALLLSVYLLAILFFGLVGLRLFPLWLLERNMEMRAHPHVQLFGWLPNVLLPHMLAIGWFKFHPRVLDAWVESHAEAARQNFLSKDTVHERRVYVALPFEVNDAMKEGRGGFTEICARPRWCILIWGEGGSGKTALACQLGRWAMENEASNRLFQNHRILPVLLEPGLATDAVKDLPTLLDTIRGQLQSLINSGDGIPMELLNELLRKRRVMVIADDLGALVGADWHVPAAADFPVACMVVTSRIRERLDHIAHERVRPRQIQATATLGRFMTSYLDECGHGDFTEEEISRACARLFKMGRSQHDGKPGHAITVMLAKLYAEQLIGMKDAGANMPRDIPNLMLGYLNELNRRNRSPATSDDAVRNAAACLAWECVRDRLRPGSIKRNVAIAHLGQGGEEMLGYLEESLGLVKVVDPSRDDLQFALDPLAEYLAGWHLLRTLGHDERAWRSLLADMDSSIARFGTASTAAAILALRDWCLTRYEEVPDFLASELGKRAGLDEGENRPPPIRVGILHSKEGPMKVSESALVDAARLAIKEINQAGGVLGRPIEGIFADGESLPEMFRRQAVHLMEDFNVCAVFGCWTSASRKAVLTEFEGRNHLLWYPVQYEGFESSPNIIYTGATPNQQIIPAIDYCLRDLARRRFLLVGSRYVFPWRANQIIRAYLQLWSDGRSEADQARVVGEKYWALDETDFGHLGALVEEAKPDVIINTVNGQGNNHLFRVLRDAGLNAATIPVMSVSIAEVEHNTIGWELTEGHYCAWSYFQSIVGENNSRFVEAFQREYGAGCMTDDPIEAAYFQIHLFARAVARAGSTDPLSVRQAVRGMEMSAPGGTVRVDEENQHTWKAGRIGRVRNERIEVVWSSDRLIRPDPYLKHYFPSGLALPDPPWIET